MHTVDVAVRVRAFPELSAIANRVGTPLRVGRYAGMVTLINAMQLLTAHLAPDRQQAYFADDACKAYGILRRFPRRSTARYANPRKSPPKLWN